MGSVYEKENTNPYPKFDAGKVRAEAEEAAEDHSSAELAKLDKEEGPMKGGC
jgi:hypothetical protein